MNYIFQAIPSKEPDCLEIHIDSAVPNQNRAVSMHAGMCRFWKSSLEILRRLMERQQRPLAQLEGDE
jgi:hypothetical protein